MKFYVSYLLGHANLHIFYDKLVEYQSKYEKNGKYKDSVASHIPYGSVALAQYLLNLPNFSENLKKYFKDYLEWSKKSLKQAFDYAKTEPFVYEFDMSITDSLKELSEVCFLISEYRVRNLSYKYAKYQQLDLARKVQRRLEQRRD